MHPFVAAHVARTGRPMTGESVPDGVLSPGAARAADYVRDGFILGVSGLLLYLTLSIKPPHTRP